MRLIDHILDYFESKIPPFPEEKPEAPPSKLLPFLWHYVRGSWIWLLLMSLMSALISILEVSLFGFLGNLVDWLGNKEPGSLLQEESPKLIWMSLVILVFLPLAGL